MSKDKLPDRIFVMIERSHKDGSHDAVIWTEPSQNPSASDTGYVHIDRFRDAIAALRELHRELDGVFMIGGGFPANLGDIAGAAIADAEKLLRETEDG